MTLEKSQWWLHLLGVDTEGMPPGAELAITWLNLPQSWQWWIVGAIIAIGGYGIFWLYRREIDTCPMWAKLVLGTLRTCSLLVLIVIVFGPALVQTKRNPLPPSIFLLRDDSHSMQFRDAYLDDGVAAHAAGAMRTSIEEIRRGSPNRVEVLHGALEKEDWKFLEQLQRRGNLHLVNFSKEPKEIDMRPAILDADEQAEPDRTNGTTVSPAMAASALRSARIYAGIALALTLGAAVLGFFAWYASAHGAKWTLGLAAAGAVLLGVMLAGVNAVQYPTINVGHMLGGLGEGVSPEGSPGAIDEQSKPRVRPLPPLEATGQGSDLYEALAASLKDRHAAAAIVFTDGQHTGEEARDMLIALAAQRRKPADQRIPVFFVGVGDPNKPRNLEVSDIYADPQVFHDKMFEVKAVVRGRGIDDRPLRVDLIEQKLNPEGGPEGGPRVVETRTDVVIPDSGKEDLNFEVQAGKPGQYAYTVRVEKIENESNDDDNEPKTPIVVKVLDEKAKVLLVAGAPTWEYRMVQRLLTREETVELSCWLQTLDKNRAQEGDTVITTLPVEKKELFEYDVVMLFDPDPIEFDPAWIELLKEFVGEHAGGVLYMAGPKFAGQFLGAPRTNKMRDVLPVRMGDVGRMEVERLLESNTRAWPLKIVDHNVDQPIMRFEADPLDSLARWNKLPGIYWSFPSEGAKPASRVLIEHSDDVTQRLSESGSRPLLVTGQYGSGKTIYMGFNGTWRWRKVGHNAEYFKKFWLQTTSHLIEGRALEGKRRGYVEADQARYDLGKSVTITAYDLRDENFNLFALKEITAIVSAEGEQPRTLTLKAVPNSEGEYQTKFTVKSTGRHVVRVQVPATTGEPPRVETAFDVSLPTVETNEVALNKPLLVDLASASGGAYFEIDQVDQIPGKIPAKVRHSEFQDKPRLLWDTNRLLLLLIALLSVEWAMRKGFKLL